MFDLLGARWTEVELTDVKAFLDDAGEEGATWRESPRTSEGDFAPTRSARRRAG
jgi:hypothetical protein